jgi:hypothetical protein
MYVNGNLEDNVVSERALPCGVSNNYATGSQRVDALPTAAQMPNIIINVQSNNSKSEDVNEQRPVTNPVVLAQTDSNTTTNNYTGETKKIVTQEESGNPKFPTEKLDRERKVRMGITTPQKKITCAETFYPEFI